MEEIIDDIADKLHHTQQTDKVLLLVDFNCRIDQTNIRLPCLLEYVSHENLICMNDPEEKTYMCNNGSNSIDLCFTSAPNRIHNLTIREFHWTKQADNNDHWEESES